MLLIAIQHFHDFSDRQENSPKCTYNFDYFIIFYYVCTKDFIRIKIVQPSYSTCVISLLECDAIHNGVLKEDPLIASVYCLVLDFSPNHEPLLRKQKC
jgi:hypothetical protein